MKLKAVVVGVLLAFAVNAVAIQAQDHGSMVRRRKPTPQNPGPKFPDLPTKPGFPGMPSDPTYPTIPTIPPPGKANPKGGPEVPFPLSITLPFPWGAIEGLWKVVSSEETTLFSFSVETDRDGRQFLRVLQLNATTGVVVAEGVGVSVEKDKLVRAAMTSKTNKVNYMLFIGSYKNTGEHASVLMKTLTVLTVRPFTSLMGDDDVQVMVEKVSNSPIERTEFCSSER
jgi:hypothetical protein